MGKSNVEIYLRVRPNPKTPLFSTVDCSANTIEFNLPRDDSGGYVNNQKVHYSFNFNGVFDNTTSQEAIFTHVAEKAVLSAVEGYNATIFAYGQTGSGKTWSITGGINKYADRGIIPRALSRCFQECLKHSDRSFRVKISCIMKVQIRESAKGNLKFTNLHKHVVTNEEEALNLLFLGDTNRMICETPMNKASSRSHCVFTVLLTKKDINTRTTGAAFVRKSKFHLVDLAGSERIGKTGVHGQILTEAKYINLSLHYLEQVIITLQENPNGHVPYRNSKVTSVLRDSLGGNCKTAMIATVNLDDDFSMESIATCKFAARVALIANDANINEHTDPKIVIAGLRQQIDMLKAELKATGKDPDEPDIPLSVDDLAMIAEMVRTYVDDKSQDSVLSFAEMRKVREAFIVFKSLVWEARDSLLKKADLQQVEQLRAVLATRDHELAVLGKLLKKMEAGKSSENGTYAKAYSPRPYTTESQDNGNAIARSPSGTVANASNRPSSAATGGYRAPDAEVLAKRQHIANIIREAEEESDLPPSMLVSAQFQLDSMQKHLPHTNNLQQPQPTHPQHHQPNAPPPSKKEAFEKFKHQHPDYADSQANHAILKEKYTVAKELSDLVTKTRDRISML